MNASPDIEFPLKGEGDTLALGADIASMLKPGDVIALYGDLGAGKTTFSRGLIQALLGDGMDVPSPTYTLVQTYDTERGTIWHFDLYRIEAPSELLELGFDDALDDISIIEWPENAGALLPVNRLSINIAFHGAARIARLSSTEPHWITRLNDHFLQSRS